MGLVVRVPKRLAQRLHRYLVARQATDLSRLTQRDASYVYFPVRSVPDGITQFSARAIHKKCERSMPAAASLSDFIGSGKDNIRKSFEIVGSIGILELDRALLPRQKEIAQYLLKAHRGITTIVKKGGAHTGRFRLQRYVHLTGKRTLVTRHIESGCTFVLDISTAYFSPRSVSERLRIARLVRPKETVLVMFSGIAPYPIVISKHSEAECIVGVELNPSAHSYAMQNIALNKAKNIELYKGDVRKIIPKLKQSFDRIIMPLPKTARSYIPLAFSCIKPGGMVHLYDFISLQDVKKLENRIAECAKKAGRRATVVRFVKAGQQAPRVFRMCADISVD